MSSVRDKLMFKLLDAKTQDLTAEEQKILQNALIGNCTERKNGLNLPALRTLLKYYAPQAGINKMKRPELIHRLKIHCTALLDFSPQRRRSISPQRSRSISPQRRRGLSPQRRRGLSPTAPVTHSVPPVLAPVPPDAPPTLLAPVDILNGLKLPKSLVNILERYSIVQPLEGKLVNKFVLREKPRYVACHEDKAYVTHDFDNKMSVLDVKSGTVRQTWMLDTYTQLEGVAVDGVHVFVADKTKNYIRVFNMDGKQERKIGIPGNGNGQFNRPVGVAIAGELLYVCDSMNHRVQVFGLDGTWVRSWGSLGTEEGKLYDPTGITVHGDEVFVADSGNSRVQVFDLDGRFRRMFGSELFDRIGDVVVHGPLVYVTDGESIQRFRVTDGSHVSTWGTYGYAIGEFNEPTGLDIDESGRLWVCDFKNYRVILCR